MALRQDYSPYVGPPVHHETWVEGDTLHQSFTGDKVENRRWIQEYAAGRTEFRDRYIEQAYRFDAANKPALAIVASRIALEIPNRSGAFIFNQHEVAEAMGVEGPIDKVSQDNSEK